MKPKYVKIEPLEIVYVYGSAAPNLSPGPIFNPPPFRPGTFEPGEAANSPAPKPPPETIEEVVVKAKKPKPKPPLSTKIFRSLAQRLTGIAALEPDANALRMLEQRLLIETMRQDNQDNYWEEDARLGESGDYDPLIDPFTGERIEPAPTTVWWPKSIETSDKEAWPETDPYWREDLPMIGEVPINTPGIAEIVITAPRIPEIPTLHIYPEISIGEITPWTPREADDGTVLVPVRPQVDWNAIPDIPHEVQRPLPAWATEVGISELPSVQPPLEPLEKPVVVPEAIPLTRPQELPQNAPQRLPEPLRDIPPFSIVFDIFQGDKGPALRVRRLPGLKKAKKEENTPRKDKKSKASQKAYRRVMRFVSRTFGAATELADLAQAIQDNVYIPQGAEFIDKNGIVRVNKHDMIPMSDLSLDMQRQFIQQVIDGTISLQDVYIDSLGIQNDWAVNSSMDRAIGIIKGAGADALADMGTTSGPRSNPIQFK